MNRFIIIIILFLLLPASTLAFTYSINEGGVYQITNIREDMTSLDSGELLVEIKITLSVNNQSSIYNTTISIFSEKIFENDNSILLFNTSIRNISYEQLIPEKSCGSNSCLKFNILPHNIYGTGYGMLSTSFQIQNFTLEQGDLRILKFGYTDCIGILCPINKSSGNYNSWITLPTVSSIPLSFLGFSTQRLGDGPPKFRIERETDSDKFLWFKDEAKIKNEQFNNNLLFAILGAVMGLFLLQMTEGEYALPLFGFILFLFIILLPTQFIDTIKHSFIPMIGMMGIGILSFFLSAKPFIILSEPSGAEIFITPNAFTPVTKLDKQKTPLKIFLRRGRTYKIKVHSGVIESEKTIIVHIFKKNEGWIHFQLTNQNL